MNKLSEAYERWEFLVELGKIEVKKFVDLYKDVEFLDHEVFVRNNRVEVYVKNDLNEAIEYFTQELERVGLKVIPLERLEKDSPFVCMGLTWTFDIKCLRKNIGGEK